MSRGGAARPDTGVELGIDTASADASLALRRGGSVLALRRWRVETTLSRELLAELGALLEGAGVRRGEIARVAVCSGPGAYTALRTGVATGQGLALGLAVPLAGVSRLEADALPHLDAARPVVAVHDAGRGRLAWAAYRAASRPGAAPREVAAPRADDAAGLARDAPAGALWCGELTEELRRELARAGRPLGAGDAAAGPAAGRRSAVEVLRLAWLHDAFGDPAGVDAVYLRPPPITRPRAAGPAHPSGPTSAALRE